GRVRLSVVFCPFATGRPTWSGLRSGDRPWQPVTSRRTVSSAHRLVGGQFGQCGIGRSLSVGLVADGSVVELGDVGVQVLVDGAEAVLDALVGPDPDVLLAPNSAAKSAAVCFFVIYSARLATVAGLESVPSKSSQ